MKRIVVGTDCTDRSMTAVRKAANLAIATGATLHLVSVVRPLAPTDPMVAGYDSFSAGKSALDSAQADIVAAADNLRREGISVETHSATGQPADLLCSVADTVDADLIVVGNRRMKGAGRVLGSVPSKVSHKANCDVMIACTG